MIKIFKYSLEKQIEAQSLPDPKMIWIDGDRIVVRTGDDAETNHEPVTDI